MRSFHFMTDGRAPPKWGEDKTFAATNTVLVELTSIALRRREGPAQMNMFKRQRSRLTEAVQSGLPTWSATADDALAMSDQQSACEKFFYQAFSDCDLPIMIYDGGGERLVTPPHMPDEPLFPLNVPDLSERSVGPGFVLSDGQLMYVYDHLERWPLAPTEIASIVVLIQRDWFNSVTELSLTASEFTLVGLLLSGRDLHAAAEAVGARYDTKRKQIRSVMEKADVSTQAALLRQQSLDLSSAILHDLLQPIVRNPESELAGQVFGRDIVIHSISLGDSKDVPVWEFGARRGHTILYFHSMLAPIMFTPKMVDQLKAHNLRILMVPRHFFQARQGAGMAQRQLLKAVSDVTEYFVGEPVVCLGESAGCAWAAQFARSYPEQVSEVVLVATPQALASLEAQKLRSRTSTLLIDVSDRIRKDERIVAGLTRIYNSIARVPSLARRSLDFMLRDAPSDLVSIDESFRELALADWVRLIANKAARASIDEVAHLHSDWVSNLHTVTRPMRFFHGSDDPLCPVEDARAMVQSLPDATFTSFDQGGHLVLAQRMDDIFSTLVIDQKSNENVIEQSA